MIISSIDIGTNTILLLIAEVDPVTKKIKSLLNEYRVPRIGKGLLPNQPISKDKIQSLYHVLGEFKKIILANNSEHNILTATNAFRIASNANKIINEVKNKFGFDIQVVTGKEEAKLSFLGVVGDYLDENKTMVIDIGGGSTEIILGQDGRINFNESYQVGVVSGTEKYLKHQPPFAEDMEKFKNFINNTLNKIGKNLFLPKRTIAIAGTPTTLACMKIGLDHYDEFAIEGSTLTKDELSDFIKQLSKLSLIEIKSTYKSIVEGRADVLLAGTIILHSILEYFNIDEVLVSTKGIRYGAIVHYIQLHS